jgi:hypothetical protein
MAPIMQRIREWMGPSKRELQAEIANLQENMRRFPRLGQQGTAAGTSITYGRFDYDPNNALNGAEKFGVFEQMEADPHVKGVLLDKALPLLTAEWEVQPASDSDRDKDVAEFVAANLLRVPSEKYGRDYWIQTSWKAQRLPEILMMLNDGFSLFVSSWRRVGTQVVYDRLQWIEPTTIDGTKPWEIDESDRIVAVNRKFTTANDHFVYDERIEADRLKLYVWDIKGARYEGRSFLRAMYGAWLRKDSHLRNAAIWAQKAGAPVPIAHYPQGYVSSQITRVKQFVMALRGESPAEAFGMFPKDADGEQVDVRYAGVDAGEVDRMRGLIRGENEEIHQGGRDSSAILGETNSGSRALGDSKGAREIKLTQAIAEMVGEWENSGVANLQGTVEDLVNRNFAVTDYPQLVCSKIDPYQNFQETIEAWNAGIIPKTPDSRRQVCEGTLGLNLPDEAYEVQEPSPTAPNVVPFQKPSEGDGGGDDAEREDEPQQAAMSAADSFRARIAPLLEPSKGGAPAKGRRFPDQARGGAGGSAEGGQRLPGRGAGHPARAAGGSKGDG